MSGKALIKQKNIQSDLNEKNIDSVSNWIQKNRSKLRKKNSKLEYRLAFYEFTQMWTDVEEKDLKSPSFVAKALDFLQKRIRSSTLHFNLIFQSTNLILKPASKINMEKKSLETLEIIKSEFSQIYFSVEGFHKSFFLENLIRVKLTSLGSWRLKPKNANPKRSKLVKRSKIGQKSPPKLEISVWKMRYI